MDTLSVTLAHRLRAFRLELTVEVGRETFAVVGASGSGKTTFLRAVAGLVRPDAGRIAVGDDVWFDDGRVDVPPERRSIGFVFQDYALFPHLSVRRNVAFGGARDVDALLAALGLAQLARERPATLSGGERQRVALARALARDPRVLLLDEPLSALDAHTRAHVRAELRERLRAAALPTLLVTHDYEDAAALADRIAVFDAGRIVQTGTPEELVASPATPFVAEFVGANLLTGSARPAGDGLTEVALDVGARILSADELGGRVGVVLHPWDVALARAASTDSMQNHVHGVVTSVVRVGNRVRVRVGPLTAEVTPAAVEQLGIGEGQPIVASFKATATRLVPY